MNIILLLKSDGTINKLSTHLEIKRKIFNMPDSLYILHDSIQTLIKANRILDSHNTWKDNLNFYLAIAGGIGTIIGLYAFYLQWKSKKPQDYVYKLAQTVMEKEDAQSQLKASKEELYNLEKHLTALQKQIKKDVPLEARKAVLSDRLDESLLNMKKYYDDVLITKNKLKELGVSDNISVDLLKTIEKEIQPRHLLEEKKANYKTLLTVTSSISGLAFAIFPYPFNKFLGVTFLILGIPMLFQLSKISYLSNSIDKARTTTLIKLIASLVGVAFFIFITFIFAVIYFTSRREYRESSELIVAAVSFVCTAFFSIISFQFFDKYKRNKIIVSKSVS